jgi:hypothetical protein
MSDSKWTCDNVQKEIRKVCDDIAELLITKNRKYGNSALQPSRIFSKASPIEQINVRIDDKLSRIKNQQEDEDEDVLFDLLGYLVLKKVCLNLQKKIKESTLNMEDTNV